MSFLLDALRKSELERRVGEIPKFTPDLPIHSVRQKRHPWVFLVVVLVLINIGTLLYMTAFDRTETDVSEKKPTGSATRDLKPGKVKGQGGVNDSEIPIKTEAPVAPIPPSKILVPEESAGPKKPSPVLTTKPNEENRQLSQVAPKIEKTPATPSPIAKPTAKTPSSPQNGRVVPDQKIARPNQPAEPPRPDPVSKTARTTKPVDHPVELKPLMPEPVAAKQVEKTVPVPPPAPVTPKETRKPEIIPLLNGMPRDFQRDVPTLKINVFVYSEIPDERFVVINMSKYLTGQKIEGGPEILEIRPDSLVLNYLGRKFRIGRP